MYTVRVYTQCTVTCIISLLVGECLPCSHYFYRLSMQNLQSFSERVLHNIQTSDVPKVDSLLSLILSPSHSPIISFSFSHHLILILILPSSHSHSPIISFLFSHHLILILPSSHSHSPIISFPFSHHFHSHSYSSVRTHAVSYLLVECSAVVGVVWLGGEEDG